MIRKNADERIGLVNLTDKAISRVLDNKLCFNIMVVGSHGLGKTTFINQILGNKVIVPQNPHKIATHHVIQKKMNVVDTELTVSGSNFKLQLEIIEVDGVGDHIETSDGTIFSYIENLFKERLRQYEHEVLNRTKGILSDPRIHCCVYFLEPIQQMPHYCTNMLKTISAFTTVLPVVSKADTIASNEIREKIVSIVSNTFEEQNIQQISCYTQFKMPFFVTSGEILSETELKTNREYPWKIIRPDDDDNDFVNLENFILAENLLKMIKETDKITHNYLKEKILDEMVQKNDKILDKHFVGAVMKLKKEIEQLEKTKKELEIKNK